MSKNDGSNVRARRSAAAALFRRPWLGSLGRALLGIACSVAALTAAEDAAAAPQVAVLVEPPPSPVQPGQAIVYRIHVSNLNKTTGTGALQVVADIPQNTHVTDEARGKCSPSACYGRYVARFGDTISWEANLGPGQSTAFDLTVNVDNTVDHPPPADGGALALDVVVKAGATKAAGGSASVAAQHSAPSFDLAVTGDTHAAAGAEAEYRIHFGNQSAAAASATLSLPIPAGASVISASRGAVRKGSAIEWSLGSIAAGHSDFRAVRLRLDPKAPEGSLVLLQPELRAAGRAAPARAPLGVIVEPPPAMQVRAKAAPNPVLAGGTVVYKLEVTNQSATAPTGTFSVMASIPMDGKVTDLKGAKCVPAACYGSYKARHGSHVVWEVPSLAPGATAPLQYAFIVDKPADAAPPPSGSLLVSTFSTSLGGSERVAVALGTAKTVGKGLPLEPLGGAPVATTTPAVPPAVSPPAAPPPPAEPVATEAEPEPPVEEIPEAELVAELPPADDEPKLPEKEIKARASWKAVDWDKYCEKRWKARSWDRHCAKRWWKRVDWSHYCKVEGKKHAGWKKFCARDFRHWKFAGKTRHKWDHKKGKSDRHRKDQARR